MCGRYLVEVEPGVLEHRFNIVEFTEAGRIAQVPRFNVAPTQSVPVVVRAEPGNVLTAMLWGFRPAWLTDPTAPAPFNVRSETAAESRLFRSAVARSRCLIPATGFYEWRKTTGKAAKQPMLLRLRSGEPFAFAGIHTRRDDGTEGCAILTTTPNELVASIHDRMPVILSRQDEAAWLDPDLDEAHAALALAHPYAAADMETFAVSYRVGNIRNDDPELARPLDRETE